MQDLLVSEKRLWFTLDQIVTHEATIGSDPSKCEALEAAMGYLEAPTPEECRHLYKEVYGGWQCACPSCLVSP